MEVATLQRSASYEPASKPKLQNGQCHSAFMHWAVSLPQVPDLGWTFGFKKWFKLCLGPDNSSTTSNLLWLQITARMSIDQCFIRQLLGQTASCGFADFFVLTGLHPHVFGTNATHWTSFCESIELCAVARLARGSPAPPGPSPRVDVVSIGTALFTRRRVSGAQAPGRDRQACGIKAIRWAYRTLQVDCLMVSLGLVISSFQKTNSGERRESLPFSLYALMRFERRILMRECLDHEVVILGMFLLLAFSCLRSSDMQRTNPSSLRWDGAVLRGTCWRTKTCRTGQPFGLIGSGFLSKGPSLGFSSFSWFWIAFFPVMRLPVMGIVQKTTLFQDVICRSTLFCQSLIDNALASESSTNWWQHSIIYGARLEINISILESAAQFTSRAETFAGQAQGPTIVHAVVQP